MNVLKPFPVAPRSHSSRTQELLAAFPSAKVILSVRESFDAWYDSVSESIYPSSMTGLTVRPPPWLAPWFRNYTSHYSMVDEVGGWVGGWVGRGG